MHPNRARMVWRAKKRREGVVLHIGQRLDYTLKENLRLEDRNRALTREVQEWKDWLGNVLI